MLYIDHRIGVGVARWLSTGLPNGGTCFDSWWRLQFISCKALSGAALLYKSPWTTVPDVAHDLLQLSSNRGDAMNLYDCSPQILSCPVFIFLQGFNMYMIKEYPLQNSFFYHVITYHLQQPLLLWNEYLRNLTTNRR